MSAPLFTSKTRHNERDHNERDANHAATINYVWIHV
jgi:hypothetical protein